MSVRVDPRQVGWGIGRAHQPRGGELWVPWDRTAGVIGPQGSGKTLDLLTPALLGAPGAALVTLTKVEDLLLSLTGRAAGGRPCVVMDPFGLTDGLCDETVRELVWDPVAGCVDPKVAERRAKAFTAETVTGAINGGAGDDAARFYAAESAKVLQGYLHAAALAGRTLDEVLRWVANPAVATEPTEILRRHPYAEPFWQGLLHGALRGDDRTAGNTTTTVQQAMSLFFQASTRRRCVPGPSRPATDISEVIRRHGTIYLLGREDPYASASPLMTAVAEHVLDSALALAHESRWGGRLCPPMLACLDELPSTAPLPTLRTRMANERALGLSFIYAAQTRAQLTSLFGEHESARSWASPTSWWSSAVRRTWPSTRKCPTSLALSGSDASPTTPAATVPPQLLRRRHRHHATRRGPPPARTQGACDRRERQAHRRQAGPLRRWQEGAALLAQQRDLRRGLTQARPAIQTVEARTSAAVTEARRLGLVDDASPLSSPTSHDGTDAIHGRQPSDRS